MSDLDDTEDLLITSSLINGQKGKPGYGIARSVTELEALLKHSFGEQLGESDLSNLIPLFKAKRRVLMAFTEACTNNYAFDYDCYTSEEDGLTVAAFTIKQLSEAQSDEKGGPAAACANFPMQSAIMFLIPEEADTAAVWVIQPNALSDIGDYLDVYPEFDGTTHSVRRTPQNPPAADKRVIN